MCIRDRYSSGRLLLRVGGGGGFAQERGIHPAEEMRGGTALVADNSVNVLSLAAAGKVGSPVSVLVLKMPGLDGLPVEVVNHNLVVVLRSSKHVAGLTQFDLVLVLKHDLVDKRAGRSSFRTRDKTRIQRPFCAVLHVDDILVGHEGRLAVRNGTGGAGHVEKHYFLPAGGKNPEQDVYKRQLHRQDDAVRANRYCLYTWPGACVPPPDLPEW